MMNIIPLRSLRARVLVVLLASQLTACDFLGVAARNVPWFFRTPRPAPLAARPRADDALLSVLWVGHATTLVQLGDRYVLTDPVFTQLVGGFSRRMVQPGLRPEALPSRVTVLVSHRHFDHLSKGSFSLIADHVHTVIAPEGAGADLPRGPYARRELGWWQTWEDDGMRITAVPARHDGGRYLHDRGGHPRAFTGYVIEYRGTSVYFAGDTAYDEALFREIGRRFPGLTLALVPIGPITPVAMMRPHHLDPAQALQATCDVGAAQMVPIHFGTYLHSYDQPGECEARFDEALLARPELITRAHRLQIGERWIAIAAWRSSAASSE